MVKSMANGKEDGALRVVLASASAVRRAGLESLLKSVPALNLVGSLQGTHDVVPRAAQLKPDVVVIDLDRESLLHVNGSANIRAVALIDHPSAGWIAQALRSGVKAILTREAGIEEILPAIFAAQSGLVLLDSAVTQNLVQRVRGPAPQPETPHENLTARETEVLAMLVEGLGNKVIANRLGVSEHTIKFHISSILDKLGAATRTEAVTLGLRMGLILL